MPKTLRIAKFQETFDRAVERKGSAGALNALLPKVLPSSRLLDIPDDRYLAMMTKCINQAGFSWKVIEKKWPEFEEAFFGFKLDTLALLSDEQWEAYTQDKRVVRSWQKIKALKENVAFLYNEKYEHKGIARLIADWPESDLVGLLLHLKKQGSRLGGHTGQRVLRNMGKDCFVLTGDVTTVLIASGLDIKPQASSQRELQAIQIAFNQWHDETGLPYSHLSKIAAYSVGDNYIT